jgi:dinuclear metal center YbgI/SA1388 family protein
MDDSGLQWGMAKLDEIVSFLNTELRLEEVPDYPGAHNGLQLQNGGEVSRVVAAVDASLPVVEKAVAAGADLLVVHHGMFWQGVRQITGAHYRKLKFAMDAGLAIYSAHIPLDVHSRLGNNALLADRLGLENRDSFFEWKGVDLGLRGELEMNLAELKELFSEVVEGPVLLRGEADCPVGRLGIITGGAGSEVEAVSACGIDTFITGEGPHWSFPLAEELGLNVLYGGHYATETFGVKRLVQEIDQQFETTSAFVHHPTGL